MGLLIWNTSHWQKKNWSFYLRIKDKIFLLEKKIFTADIHAILNINGSHFYFVQDQKGGTTENLFSILVKCFSGEFWEISLENNSTVYDYRDF